MKDLFKKLLLFVEFNISKSLFLNSLIDKITSLFFPKVNAVGCLATYPFEQGAYCWDTLCDGVPYHGYLCSIGHIYRPRYTQPDGSKCDGPCPFPGDDAYITRSPCTGPCPV